MMKDIDVNASSKLQLLYSWCEEEIKQYDKKIEEIHQFIDNGCLQRCGKTYWLTQLVIYEAKREQCLACLERLKS